MISEEKDRHDSHVVTGTGHRIRQDRHPGLDLASWMCQIGFLSLSEGRRKYALSQFVLPPWAPEVRGELEVWLQRV